jgi:hypothetical protein
MDGAKQATDTSDSERRCRKVFCGSRNQFVSSGESRKNKNLADSNSEAGKETQPPEGPGFLSNDKGFDGLDESDIAVCLSIQLRVSRS